MLWTVQHCCPVGERIVFNGYKHWVQLLLPQSGEPPILLRSREGITQGYYLLVVLYGITLVPLVEQTQAEDPCFLPLFYTDNTSLYGKLE